MQPNNGINHLNQTNNYPLVLPPQQVHAQPGNYPTYSTTPIQMGVQNSAKPPTMNYDTNMPENPVNTHCPHCSQDTLTRVTKYHNLCCMIMVVLDTIGLIFGILRLIMFGGSNKAEIRENAKEIGKLWNLELHTAELNAGIESYKSQLVMSVIGSLIFVALFLFLTHLSRAWKHFCSKCNRELGRGKPSQGCCTTNIA